jgi:cytochrome b
MSEVAEGLAAETASRWDRLVRITHWSVAVAVLLNGLVTTEGGQVHVWIGHAAFALLALRLIWGFVGTAEARFASFPASL